MKSIEEIIKQLDVKELHRIKELAETLIEEKSSAVKPYLLTLYYNLYKGSGKCWVANVDKDTKKILGFINTESYVKIDTYKGKKNFLLKDGYYLACDEGTKSRDNRVYFRIVNGEYVEE